MGGLPLLAALTTYIQSAVMAPPNSDPPSTSYTKKTMSYFLPVMIFMASKGFAAGLALYWVISNIFTIVQQLISNRSLGKIKEDK